MSETNKIIVVQGNQGYAKVVLEPLVSETLRQAALTKVKTAINSTQPFDRFPGHASLPEPYWGNTELIAALKKSWTITELLSIQEALEAIGKLPIVNVSMHHEGTNAYATSQVRGCAKSLAWQETKIIQENNTLDHHIPEEPLEEWGTVLSSLSHPPSMQTLSRWLLRSAWECSRLNEFSGFAILQLGADFGFHNRRPMEGYLGQVKMPSGVEHLKIFRSRNWTQAIKLANQLKSHEITVVTPSDNDIASLIEGQGIVMLVEARSNKTAGYLTSSGDLNPHISKARIFENMQEIQRSQVAQAHLRNATLFSVGLQVREVINKTDVKHGLASSVNSWINRKQLLEGVALENKSRSTNSRQSKL